MAKGGYYTATESGSTPAVARRNALRELQKKARAGESEGYRTIGRPSIVLHQQRSGFMAVATQEYEK
jgi:hypothetical protein